MKVYFWVTLACFMFSGHARAGEIEFSSRMDVLNDEAGSSVLTNGCHVAAGNVRGGRDAAVINGITFESFSWGRSLVTNDVTVSLVDLGDSIDYNDVETVNPYYSQNPGLSSMMGVGYKSAYYANGIGIQMSGLKVGQTYQLQGFYWDAGPNTSLYVCDGDVPENRSGTFPTTQPAKGYYWLATWTADSAVKTIDVCPGRSSRSILSGISLREVGEPIHIALEHTWDSLNIGGLMWDDDAGLWQNYMSGSKEGEQDRPVVHNTRFCAGSLLLAAQYGLLDDPRMEKALRSFKGLQDESTGRFRGDLERSGQPDGNVSFFVCRLLLLLNNGYADQLTPASKILIDEMLNASYQWFYEAALEDKAFYPNAYLGDLVCAKLIQEASPFPQDEVEELNERMMAAAQYWLQNEWGWGEHMSDTYGGVCMDLLSQYLLFTKQSDTPLYAEYKKLLNDLLAIEDLYEGGPRVPAIRSYSFTSRGHWKNYRDKINPWNDLRIESNPFWRESNLISAALSDAGWHRRLEPPRAQMRHDVKIPCFGGVVASAIQEEEIRLGSLSKFPVMPNAENITWGLAWQSFPVAFWKPQGDWGFLQWQTVEDGQVKAHPASQRTGARALTSHINPPVCGQTFSIQRGGDLLVVRIMPKIMQTWETVSDSFKLINGTAEVTDALVDASFNQMLLSYSNQTVSICSIPSEAGLSAAVEEQGNAMYWTLNYTPSTLGGADSLKMIVDVWGISLNGPVTDVPVIEFEENTDIPLVEAQQKRRLTWQWPQTKWDVIIDPMAENPLRSVAE